LISLPSLIQPALRETLRRADLERRLALVLAVCAVVAGIATYAVMSGGPPYGAGVQTVIILLNLDLILLLLLGIVVTRRLVRVILQRRRGAAGSGLHLRLVAMFSVVAATPAILVAVFAVVFLSSGLEQWFSERIRGALDNSLAVAEAYLAEHREVIRADAVAMSQDLNREGPALLQIPGHLRGAGGAARAHRGGGVRRRRRGARA
jgi:two-component system nitrogen regulation sensor histidine kinase NtrY